MTGSGGQPSRRESDLFEPSGFFVLRTPLLPFGDLLAGGVDEASSEWLQRLLARPEVGDALHLASPSLTDLLSDPESRRARRATAALMSYLIRMCSRPTPFGLFAGCAVGMLGEQTSLAVPHAGACGRHTRLDNDYLAALVAALEHEPAMRADLTWRPNSSLYRAGGRLRYAEARLAGLERNYHLVAVDESPEVTGTLERAAAGATLADLVGALVDDDVTLDEAEAFIDELIDAQLLVSDLQLHVTGDEPIHPLIARLSSTAAGRPVAARLDEVRLALEKLDAAGPGARPEDYRRIQAILDPLPVRAEPARLFQVDATKPSAGASLGPRPLAEMLRAIELLHRLAPPAPETPLQRFREAFLERYEDREVPLPEVLDEEIGIGFDTEAAAETAPLLDGLTLGTQHAPNREFGPRDDLLLAKLTEALRAGRDTIDLDDADLVALATPESERTPLPDALELMATLAAPSVDAADDGDFRLFVQGISGAPGVRLLGRFCHADEELHQRVVEHLRAEEGRRPDAVFAEIAHLPEGRLGNILCRPVLRRHEIPFLGTSGAPLEHQIPVTDLLVSVAGDRVVLRSRRLDREVLPRLTSAHNFGYRSLGVYRFLCSLQHQGTVPGLSWNWGALSGAPFLPRVTCGRLVLSRATWRLRGADLANDVDVAALRARRGLPRFVALADGDNELVIDLENPLMDQVFTHHLKRGEEATLVELFPGPDDLCATGPDGRYTHEVVVPFVRAADRAAPRHVVRHRTPTIPRSFPPGSEWTYAKLYTGVATIDQVLTDVVRPVVDRARAEGLADAWFFVRFADPHWHLRFRLHGPSDTLLPLIHAAAAPLVEDGRVWRIQLDTYEREIERYGGDDAMVLSEQLFHHDSEAVLAQLEMLWGDEGLDARWRLALAGTDALLGDFGFDDHARQAWARQRRDAFAREFRIDGPVRGRIGERFRRERHDLEALLDGTDPDHWLRPGLDILRRRSDMLAPICTEIRARGLDVGALAAGYAHMHANRLLRSAHRAQEAVIFDLLHRLYSARLARAGS